MKNFMKTDSRTPSRWGLSFLGCLESMMQNRQIDQPLRLMIKHCLTLNFMIRKAKYKMWYTCFSTLSSVSQSCPTLWPHGLQHARPPCPSPAPGVYPNPCPLSWWCHPIISSSVVPFFSCPQSFPASASTLRIKWPEYWSFSFSISPSNSELWVDFYVTPQIWIPCVRLRLRFISVPVNIQCSSTNLLKRPSFLHGGALTLLSKISLIYLCGHSFNIRFAFLLF